MTSTGELGKMFWEGKDRGTASRTALIRTTNGAMLIDYGWAVLAERIGNTIHIYDGWDKYSPTTSKHISQLGLRREGENIIHHAERKEVG